MPVFLLNIDKFLQDLNFDKMLQTYDINSIGAIRFIKTFLPLTEKSDFKRLCFVSSEAGSIALSHRDEGLGYCMSKTALNMAVKLMFNHLRPSGYTFRLYNPGWMRSYMRGFKSTVGDIEPQESAEAAIKLFLEDREDEGRLVLIDNLGCELSF